MEYIKQIDTELFFFLNGLHTPWLDPVMFYLTNTLTSIPLFIFLIYLLAKTYGKKIWVPLLCVGICIALADGTTNKMKKGFGRLRPTHEVSIAEKVHKVNGYKGGKFSFASGHAANTFGLAMLVFLLLRKHYRFMGLLFLWSGVVSYTRIYMGLHYPADIIVGLLIGLLFGWLAFRLHEYIQGRLARPER
ncbi:MAG: phosphatase PAP2 family protein [Cyclobacteriaceae bacterium]|nr:phosphatase PAP2 family protein [Cyclobacteriaceae bacterium]